MDHLTSLENQQDEYARICQKDLAVMRNQCKELSNQLKSKGSDETLISFIPQPNASKESSKVLKNTFNELTITERNLKNSIKNRQEDIKKLKNKHAQLLRDKIKLEQTSKQQKSEFQMLNHYKKHLQILITSKKVVDDQHMFVVVFKKFEQRPVEITVDINDNKIIAVDLTKLKNSEPRQELEKWLNTNREIVPFLIQLRKCIVKEYN